MFLYETASNNEFFDEFGVERILPVPVGDESIQVYFELDRNAAPHIKAVTLPVDTADQQQYDLPCELTLKIFQTEHGKCQD